MIHTETQMSIPHKYEQSCGDPDTVALFHDVLRSGTECKTEKTMDSVSRHVSSCRMVHHPSTGWNLLMTGSDLLNGDTDKPAVLQRSESGQGILGAKESRGMWLWSTVVVEVRSCRHTCQPTTAPWQDTVTI